MIDLAARGGITITVDDICANDQYDFERGTNAYLRHKPTLGNRGEVIAYYAVATFADGRTPAFVVLGKGEAEEHRDKFASTKTKEGEIYGTWGGALRRDGPQDGRAEAAQLPARHCRTAPGAGHRNNRRGRWPDRLRRQRGTRVQRWSRLQASTP